VKHLKVSKELRKLALKLSAKNLRGNEDANIVQAIKESIEALNKGAPPEIKKSLYYAKRWINCLDHETRRNAVSSRFCLEWGLAVGVGVSMACMELAKVRPPGADKRTVRTQSGNTVEAWDLLKAEYRRNPKRTIPQIYIAADAKFDKEFPKMPFPLSLSYVQRRFKAEVKNQT
jgi:hypothetical protein